MCVCVCLYVCLSSLQGLVKAEVRHGIVRACERLCKIDFFLIEKGRYDALYRKCHELLRIRC